MRAGELNRLVIIQQRSTAVDSYGQQSATWTNLFTAWAGIEPLSARELLSAQSVRSEVSHKITVRFRPELANPVQAAALRISYKSRLFNISGALNIDENNQSIEMFAAEGLNNG